VDVPIVTFRPAESTGRKIMLPTVAIEKRRKGQNTLLAEVL